MKFKDFKYERISLESIQTDYPKLLQPLKEATNKEEFEAAFSAINAYRSHLQTMMSICSIRNTMDTSDSFYETEQEYWDTTAPKIQVFENEFLKVCIQCPFKDELSIPQTFFKLAQNSIACFDESIIDLLQQENKLSTQYGKLKSSAAIEFNGNTYNLASIQPLLLSNDRETRKQAYAKVCEFYAQHEHEFDDIYDQLVQVRDQMAKRLGYSNFIELGYKRMNRLDYNQEMVANYRKQILDVVTPICTSLFEKQAKRLGLDTLQAYDLDYEYPSGNATPKGSSEDLVKAAQDMYHHISKETGSFFDMMIENELFDLVTRPNKAMGGYCSEIPDYKVPFIFSNFNGTSGDVDVLTHEAGHAFQLYTTYQHHPDIVNECAFPTYESCEIHSMSMEFFAHPYMENFFKEDKDKYIYSHIASALRFLPYGVLVDHFQHEVYAKPTMSKEERKATWRNLEKMYIPERQFEEFPILEKGTWFYRQGHIFQSPFYYIDYTLAQVCALQFYGRSIDNDPNTWADYYHLCTLGGTQSFLQLLESAHLQSPFTDGCLSSIVAKMQSVLDSIDDSKF